MPAQAIVGALFLAAMIALVVWLVRVGQRATARAKAAWTETAQKLAGSFSPKAGHWYARTWRIDARVDDLPIEVDHYTVSTGKSAQIFTRIRAQAEHAGPLRLKVHPRHALSGLAALLGFQELRTGDEAFDKAFVVRANDPALARAWLGPEERAALLEAPKYVFALKGGKLSAETPALEGDPAQLTRAIQACARLGRAGQRLSARWDELATQAKGQLVSEGEGRWRIDLADAPVPLRIDTSAFDDQVGTTTRVTGKVIDPKAERFELLATQDTSTAEGLSPVAEAERLVPAQFRLASSEPDRTAGRWNEGLRKRIAELDPQQIVSDGKDVRVVLRGVETDQARIDEAMALADELARAPVAAPYR